MTIHTKHSPAHCEVCAAQQEADALGAIPTAGHQTPGLDETADAIAEAICTRQWDRLRMLLVDFAEEIKRQAVEP